LLEDNIGINKKQQINSSTTNKNNKGSINILLNDIKTLFNQK
jgi:hypothetical protein